MEMIERVARAIALEALDPETRAAVDPEKWFVAESYYDLARAAIEALREPTDAMVEASAAIYGDDWRNRHEYSKDQWRAMVDAALRDS